MARRLIEVERRFMIPKNCKQRLLDFGAKLITCKTFHDIYYDNAQNALCINDYWLRKRDSQWELKCPPDTRVTSRATKQYIELSSANDIMMKVVPLLKPPEARLGYYAGNLIVYIN